MNKLKLFLVVALVATLTACGSFEKAVNGNVENYKLYSDVQLAQQSTLISCYANNPNKSECSILAAGTNATQTLAGKPDAIRIPKSPEEVLGAIAEKGFDSAITVYGIKAVQSAITSVTNIRPEIVHPEIVRPEVVQPQVIFPPTQ